MSKKPVTLWRPPDPDDETPVERPYHVCAAPFCAKIVGRPGEHCVDHATRRLGDDRSPIRLF